MASAVLHLAIAKQLKDKLSIDSINDYYLGSIAPDISKQIGENKTKSHFLTKKENEIPNIDLFVKRYPTFKYNSFELGYFIHLYSDKLWQENIINKIKNENCIKLLDGTLLNSNDEEIINLIYSDYTTLNKQVIEEYDLDLSLFYEEFKKPDTTLNEVPVDKLDILINKMGIIIENSKENKPYTFDIYIIKNYIEDTVEEILKEIEKY